VICRPSRSTIGVNGLGALSSTLRTHVAALGSSSGSGAHHSFWLIIAACRVPLTLVAVVLFLRCEWSLSCVLLSARSGSPAHDRLSEIPLSRSIDARCLGVGIRLKLPSCLLDTDALVLQGPVQPWGAATRNVTSSAVVGVALPGVVPEALAPVRTPPIPPSVGWSAEALVPLRIGSRTPVPRVSIHLASIRACIRACTCAPRAGVRPSTLRCCITA
jgi:hypothetical protein